MSEKISRRKTRDSVISALSLFENFYKFLCNNGLQQIEPYEYDDIRPSILLEYKKLKEFNPKFPSLINVSRAIISWHELLGSNSRAKSLHPLKEETSFVKTPFGLKSEALEKLIERFFQIKLSEMQRIQNQIMRAQNHRYPSIRKAVTPKILKSSNYPFAIRLCNMVLLFENQLDNQEALLKQLQDRKKEKKIKKVINAEDKNAFEQILRSFTETQDEIVLNSIKPLVGRLDFLQLIIDNKIIFSSEDEPEISKKLSFSLNQLSEIKGFRKAGNPKGGLNTLLPANEFAKKIGPVIDKMRSDKLGTFQSIADFLNNENVKTLRDNDWSRSTVKRTWERWKKLKAEENKKFNQLKP